MSIPEATIEEEKADNYIQQRLDSLHDIDCKVVSILDNISNLFETYSNPVEGEQLKEAFVKQTQSIYSILSTVAIDFRKEIRLMDENIGVYTKNKDGVMILPIAVDQKNTTLGSQKLGDQLEELTGLLDNTKSDDNIKNEDVPIIDMEEVNPPTFEVPDEVMESSGIENADVKMNDEDDIFEDIM